MQTFTLRDFGLETTFYKKRFAGVLGLRGPVKSISVQPFSTETRAEPIKEMKVSPTVSSLDGEGVISLQDVMTVDQ